MDQTFRNKTISGVIWKAMESGGNQLVKLVISLVLARMLDPSYYTTLSLVLVFIAFADVFVKRGFSDALIQKKDADNTDFSSALWGGLCIAAVMYVVLFVSAPSIAAFYKQPVLQRALRVVAVVLFSGAFNTVQGAIIRRKLEFRKLCAATLGATLVSGGVGIAMAYAGFGVWALIVQQILGSYVTVLVLWVADRWKPALVFSKKSLQSLYGFGWKLMASSLLDTGYSKLDALVIGKRFTSNDTLAFYSRGRQYPELIGTSLTSVALDVLFPAFSSFQDDRKTVLNMMRNTNRTAALMVFPMMTGMAAVAETMVHVLLTEKWAPCVPFLQIMCIEFALYPIEAIELQAVNAVGRSDLYLKMEIAKKIAGVAAICVAVFLFATPEAIAIARVATAFFSLAITMPVIRQLYGYRLREQASDMLPPFLLSAVMGAAVLLAGRIELPDVLSLLMMIVVGAAVYIGLAFLFRLRSMAYLREAIDSYLQRKRTAKTAEPRHDTSDKEE